MISYKQRVGFFFCFGLVSSGGGKVNLPFTKDENHRDGKKQLSIQFKFKYIGRFLYAYGVAT